MPSVLEDPSAPLQPRMSPFESQPLNRPPYSSNATRTPSSLRPLPVAPFDPAPLGIAPHTITLRDGSAGTILPLTHGPSSVPSRLLATLCALLNAEILGGDTYPMMETMTNEGFGKYWTGNFCGVMLQGNVLSSNGPGAEGQKGQGVGDEADGQIEAVLARLEAGGVDWAKVCLGSFYIKPNYPGRSSHVCNAGFLVSAVARGKGVGRLMGEAYLDWAPRLGYIYSIFNLVYETNIASLRIWDALGFQRVGRVKGAGNLRGVPDRFVDAIVYGRDLAIGEGLGANKGDQKLVAEA